VCDLETSRMGAPYIYDISHLRVNKKLANCSGMCLCLMLSFALSSKFSYLLLQ